MGIIGSIELALKSTAWPFIEAAAVLKKINNTLPKKGYVLFEAGYGPSGLPHIGTFGELVRTTMVKRAFEYISGMPTKLLCISDDIDGMRKIPDTISDKEKYSQYIGLPLSRIPDPFNQYKSFAEQMNVRFCNFLDSFGFEYEFKSATRCYENGEFNEALLKALENYDKIMDVMLPTLGEERRATYSPFLPICVKTGKVLQAQVIGRDIKNGTITYINEDKEEVVTKVTDGYCKLQWKPDFGMRWSAFDVDFEMYGKDHLVNGPIYSKICDILGGQIPHQTFYELFLDENGEKISKSKGNGLTIDEWLKYAPKESLSLFMYTSPKKAKKLYFDVIPKYTDEYLAHLASYSSLDTLEKKFSSPIYHIHHDNIPMYANPGINYSIVMNLVSACNTGDENTIWGYIEKFSKNKDLRQNEVLKKIVSGAMNYYHDFIAPKKEFRVPSQEEKAALIDLKKELIFVQSREMSEPSTEELQNLVYRIGKHHNFDLKNWFQSLYEILLGSKEGPRLGSFIALYGIDQIIDLIGESIKK